MMTPGNEIIILATMFVLCFLLWDFTHINFK